jgi:arabinan endo-1,5-alpha-L-arabinosidase
MRGAGRATLPRMKRAFLLTAVLVLAALPAAAAANPVLSPAPDPGVTPFGNGFFAFSTAGRVDVHATADGVNWQAQPPAFAAQPGWVQPGTALWAPEAYPLPGAKPRFVLLYSGQRAGVRDGAPGFRCLGRATSSTLGNFRDTRNRTWPLCSPTVSRLIDPSLFRQGGKAWLVYKHGPASRIVIRSIGPRTRGGLGPEKSLLTPVGNERITESPVIVRRGRFYYLFFSAGSFPNESYRVKVARSRKLFGPYARKPAYAILTGKGDPRFCGTGGQDVTHTAAAGWVLWYHAYTGERGTKCLGARKLMRDTITWRNKWPVIKGGHPSR